MRLGILDLGTNTFNLLVVDLHADNTITTIFKTKIPVMLGTGGINRNTIEIRLVHLWTRNQIRKVRAVMLGGFP